MSHRTENKVSMGNFAIDKRDHAYVYDFMCEACECGGELLVPIDERRSFGCPEGCGATYVQWHPPGRLAALKCVVRPVFGDAR
jgi:hypothetical protein